MQRCGKQSSSLHASDVNHISLIQQHLSVWIQTAMLVLNLLSPDWDDK